MFENKLSECMKKVQDLEKSHPQLDKDLIDSISQIINELAEEVCLSEGVAFELPAMILLRSAKEKILSREFKIFHTENDFREIINYLQQDIDALKNDYPEDVVAEAFLSTSFRENCDATLIEVLRGDVKLIRKVCDSIYAKNSTLSSID